jgi:hypothetical protein
MPSRPKPARVMPAIQFSWARLISRVSSMETIFFSGGMNWQMAFSVVVLPEAVPPASRNEAPISITNHMKEAISALMVP